VRASWTPTPTPVKSPCDLDGYGDRFTGVFWPELDASFVASCTCAFLWPRRGVRFWRSEASAWELGVDDLDSDFLSFVDEEEDDLLWPNLEMIFRSFEYFFSANSFAFPGFLVSASSFTSPDVSSFVEENRSRVYFQTQFSPSQH
jgi:hypothetical protein